MRRNRYFRIFHTVVVAFLLTGSLVFANETMSNEYTDLRTYARAQITDIETSRFDSIPGINLIETRVYLKILSGEQKGKTRVAIFRGESNLPKDMSYQKGDTVFIGISETEPVDSVGYISIYDADNTGGIIVLLALLVLAILIIGRIRGLASLLALCITIILLFFVLIPLTLNGYPPLPIAIGISVISICITLPIIAGFNKKTLAAIFGASGGIIIAAILAISFGYIMNISGIVTDDMLAVFYASEVNIDLRGIVLSGMIIAALGAIMDISISISSAANEIFFANPAIPDGKAFRSILTIGKDILGSMVNTLILAYVGSSLALVLWIAMKIQPDMPFWMIMNYNPVLSEIVKSVIGSIGMFVSIPLTAYISIKLLRKSS